ncbi:hypothetical protein [Hydrogenophaga sp.]|uniref:hypothetical protein n=1 Tax=Hydrogenophaga sp. TaxID=1904254 RepID=UPI00271B5FB7|nr:hypothetical protein [Hydrogenophaga sp.]MDO9434860.1 hypothetical protein [Hydrogenophaga sp.]
MRGILDFSSWSTGMTTLLGLVLASLVLVGVRLVFMQTFQRRRERQNRQINERLKVLIAAYKTLGGSFTGNLLVDPTHLRDARRDATDDGEPDPTNSVSERRRRIRDAVEAALSDVILLGTEDQVELAARAANDMVAGRNVETAALVVSLRNFIREALDLTPIPTKLSVPNQGPLRVSAGGAGSTGRRGADAQGARAGGARGGGGGAQGGGAGWGMGLGMGAGSGAGAGAAVAGAADAGETP